MISNSYSLFVLPRAKAVILKRLKPLRSAVRIALAAVTAAVLFLSIACSAGPSKSGNVRAAGNQNVPVSVVAAVQKDLPVYLVGLGSVTPLNTVSVKSRVDGQLVTVAYKEGQN